VHDLHDQERSERTESSSSESYCADAEAEGYDLTAGPGTERCAQREGGHVDRQ